MSVFKRIGREYVAQIIGFAVTVADRLLTAGILVRLWGAEGFAAWTVALSAAGMLALFDFGLTAYFSNRLFFAVEQKAIVRARHVFGAGNAALIVAGTVGFVIICVGFAATRPSPSGAPLFATMALLALAAAARQGMAVVIAVYRAHQDFFRQTMVTTLGDSVRIAATIAIAIVGGSILQVAAGYLVATLLSSVLLPLVDVARRYSGFAYRVEAPDREERGLAFVTSLRYWLQGAVSTLVTFAPVFFLASAGAAAHALAQFALMRTLANLVRAVLQLFANVFGLEAARRIAVRDAPGFSQVYRESVIFLAVQTSVSAGVLAALAQPLFTVWTGDASLFDEMLLWLAIGPPLLLPSLSIAVQVLTCANMPTPLLHGRIAQLVITVGAFFVLPVPDTAMRMMLALAIGEIAGLGIPATRAIHAIDPAAGLGLHLGLVWRSIMAAGLSYLLVSRLVAALPDRHWIGLAAGGAAGLLALVLATATIGITDARRKTAMALLTRRFRSAHPSGQ